MKQKVKSTEIQIQIITVRIVMVLWLTSANPRCCDVVVWYCVFDTVHHVIFKWHYAQVFLMRLCVFITHKALQIKQIQTCFLEPNLPNFHVPLIPPFFTYLWQFLAPESCVSAERSTVQSQSLEHNVVDWLRCRNRFMLYNTCSDILRDKNPQLDSLILSILCRWGNLLM